MTVGIPVKLLHEAVGHIVTIELKTSETYRGKLLDVEGKESEADGNPVSAFISLFFIWKQRFQSI